MKLMDSVDDRVDVFNDLFLTCLDNHAPIKTLKLKRKSWSFPGKIKLYRENLAGKELYFNFRKLNI